MLSNIKDGQYFFKREARQRNNEKFNKSGENVQMLLELAQSYSHDMNNNLGPQTLDRALATGAATSHLRDVASRRTNIMPLVPKYDKCVVETCSNELPSCNFASFTICAILAPALLVAPPQNHNIEEYVQAGNGLYTLMMYEAFSKKLESAGNKNIVFEDLQKAWKNALFYGGHMVRQNISAFPNLASPYVMSENHSVPLQSAPCDDFLKPASGTNKRTGPNAIPAFNGTSIHNIFWLSSLVDDIVSKHHDPDIAVVMFLQRKADELCMLLSVYKSSAHLVYFPFSKERVAEVNAGERFRKSLAGPQCLSGNTAFNVMSEFREYSSCNFNMAFYTVDILTNWPLLSVILPSVCSIFSRGETTKAAAPSAGVQKEKKATHEEVVQQEPEKSVPVKESSNTTLEERREATKEKFVEEEEEEEEVTVNHSNQGQAAQTAVDSRKMAENNTNSAAADMEVEEEEIANQPQLQEKPKKRKKQVKK
jgi:hypothetical protein